MEQRFDGRLAFVTGAGIGRTISMRLAAEGAKVLTASMAAG